MPPRRVGASASRRPFWVDVVQPLWAARACSRRFASLGRMDGRDRSRPPQPLSTSRISQPPGAPVTVSLPRTVLRDGASTCGAVGAAQARGAESGERAFGPMNPQLCWPKKDSLRESPISGRPFHIGFCIALGQRLLVPSTGRSRCGNRSLNTVEWAAGIARPLTRKPGGEV